VTDLAASLFLLLQIFFVDLLLGADNAIVIAMACGRLPPEDMRRAVLFGAAGAILLRLAMLLFANTLLGVPLVKLVGAWMLLVIALNVRTQGVRTAEAAAGSRAGAQDFLSAAVVIMFADAAMSLDNVVALAAIAGGAFWLLTLGVLISIPILVYGAFILTRIMRHAPEIFVVGAAFLGWIAGAMAVTDPLVASWIDANAPALGVFAPALGALFVLAVGKGVRRPAVLAASAPPEAGRAPPLGLEQSVAVAAAPVRYRSPPVARPPRVAPHRPPVTPSSAGDVLPGFASEAPAAGESTASNEERLVIAGFILLAVLAGLIIFSAAFYDSLT
jgi:YjbE family integral membrane protein